MNGSYNFSTGKRGSVVSPEDKVQVALYLDMAILEHFRKQAAVQGKGYQTLINDALSKAISTSSETAAACSKQ